MSVSVYESGDTFFRWNILLDIVFSFFSATLRTDNRDWTETNEVTEKNTFWTCSKKNDIATTNVQLNKRERKKHFYEHVSETCVKWNLGLQIQARWTEVEHTV